MSEQYDVLIMEDLQPPQRRAPSTSDSHGKLLSTEWQSQELWSWHPRTCGPRRTDPSLWTSENVNGVHPFKHRPQPPHCMGANCAWDVVHLTGVKISCLFVQLCGWEVSHHIPPLGSRDCSTPQAPTKQLEDLLADFTKAPLKFFLS